MYGRNTIGATEITTDASAASIAATTRYYSCAGMLVASRTNPGTLTWLGSDPQGTTQAAVDATTLATTIRKQDPYGNPRGTLPTWPNSRGFVGGTTEPTALIHLGARMYDPTTGRFTSPDPMLGNASGQQANPYSYAQNNPASRSDPNGACAKSDDGDLCVGQPISKPAPAPVPPGGGAERRADPQAPSRGPDNPHPPVGGTPGTKVASSAHPRVAAEAIKRFGFGPLCDTGNTAGVSMCGSMIQNTLRNLMSIDFLGELINDADRAGIDPRLLLAVLMDESGDCHCGMKGDWDPGVKTHGIGNMSRASYDLAATFAASNGDFSLTNGYELSWNDPSAGMRATAWDLARLESALPSTFNPYYSAEEMTRIAYNFTPEVYNKVLHLDRPAKGDPAKVVQNFDRDWDEANYWLCSGVVYGC